MSRKWQRWFDTGRFIPDISQVQRRVWRQVGNHGVKHVTKDDALVFLPRRSARFVLNFYDVSHMATPRLCRRKR
jgi:hypothetical protein